MEGIPLVKTVQNGKLGRHEGLGFIKYLYVHLGFSSKKFVEVSI